MAALETSPFHNYMSILFTHLGFGTRDMTPEPEIGTEYSKYSGYLSRPREHYYYYETEKLREPL